MTSISFKQHLNIVNSGAEPLPRVRWVGLAHAHWQECVECLVPSLPINQFVTMRYDSFPVVCFVTVSYDLLLVVSAVTVQCELIRIWAK